MLKDASTKENYALYLASFGLKIGNSKLFWAVSHPYMIITLKKRYCLNSLDNVLGEM